MCVKIGGDEEMKIREFKPICMSKFYENVFEGMCFELECNYKAECKRMADENTTLEVGELSSLYHSLCLKCD